VDIDSWLQQATQDLSSAGIETARLDALVLLEDAAGKDRTHLLAHPELELSSEQQNVLAGWLKRRAAHEPLAYIRGKTEFYGRTFAVSPAVLEPRPESETMIELLLQYASQRPQKGPQASGNPPDALTPLLPIGTVRIADVGTGSGALGITAKLELPEATVELLEIDPSAIEVAKMNVINHTTSISVIESDLLAQSSQNYDVLLCNLPYVPDGHAINTAATHEPALAIFGGPDGLDLYRKLFEQIDNLQNKPLLILTESLPEQHEALRLIAAESGYTQDTEVDFIQAFKSS